MICNTCSQNLLVCTCPDIDARLRRLSSSRGVYVGNIIAERIRRGLSRREDYPGDVHGPFGSEEAARKAPTLQSHMERHYPKNEGSNECTG